MDDNYKDDILVIQEAEDPGQMPTELRERYPHDIYVPGVRGRGLLVMASDRYQIDIAPVHDDTYKFIVPIAVTGDIESTLIAVWGQKTDTLWYTDYDLEGIKLYKSLIDESTIVAGDFNSTPTVKKPRRSAADHAELVTWLGDHGLVSIYHQTSGEGHGDEAGDVRIAQEPVNDLPHRLPLRIRSRDSP